MFLVHPTATWHLAKSRCPADTTFYLLISEEPITEDIKDVIFLAHNTLKE